MKKHILRREFLKLKLNGKSYKECKNLIEQRFEIKISIITLKRWWKRFNLTEWDLMDISQRPHTVHYKFTEKEKEFVVSYRKKQGYSGQKLRIKLKEQDLFMS
jgi:transposase